MQPYEIRRGHGKNLQGESLKALVRECFGSVKQEGDKLVTSFGALERLTCWTDGKNLYIDTLMNPGVPDEEASRTIRNYNAFLEKATGFTAKERGRRTQKVAKGET